MIYFPNTFFSKGEEYIQYFQAYVQNIDQFCTTVTCPVDITG